MIGKQRSTNDKISGTSTICFISHNHLSPSTKVTYANLICDLRPLKDEKHRVRSTVAGDRLDYVADPSSPAASLIDIQIYPNNTISNAHRGSQYDTANIEHVYVNAPMKTFRYRKISL